MAESAASLTVLIVRRAILRLPRIAWLGPCLIRQSLLLLALSSLPVSLMGAERVTVEVDGQIKTLEGEVLVEDSTGGVLLQTADGRLWTCNSKKITRRDKLPAAITPLTGEEIGRQVMEELGPGFKVHQTQHYVVVYNTPDEYARWCASLFERLHRGFYVYWKTRGWKLSEPKFPLVALVFNSREAFDQYAKKEIGDSASSMIGYYNLQSNRMTMFALPDTERRIATIVHEAAHQIAYNSSLQTRFADNPMWVSEGLAVYFESPDLSNSRGWGTIGKINDVNLQRFRQYAQQRPADSLATLLQNDQRFTTNAAAAYGEAWALNYFLLKTKSKEYVAYLQKIAGRPPLQAIDPQQRLDDFSEAFGDLAKLDLEFMRFMARLK